MGIRAALTDPDIGRHLLREEGEVIVDEVRKHWVVYVVPMLITLAGVLVFWLFLITPVQFAWVPLVAAVVLLVWAAAKALSARVDRFVVTNMRVFRVRGVFVRSLATMPLTRILDITVIKPLAGRALGYGHFTFESAGEHGMRVIRFVPRPDERDLTIQRVVQRSGLRGPRVVN
ncbi:MAG: PH domain-containing protein [Marmoricola sp.]